MALTFVQGLITDVCRVPMRTRQVRLWWQLNEPATTAGSSGATLSTDRVYAAISETGSSGIWNIEVEATDGMTQADRYYTVGWDWLDSEGNFISVDIFPAKIYVPSSSDTIYFADIIRDWSHPLAVVVSSTKPPVREMWWYDPDDGLLYMKRSV